MSRNYVAMPTIRPRNAMIDFSPVAGALDSWRDQTNTNTRNAMMREQMAQQQAQQEFERGLQLQREQRAADEFQYNVGRRPQQEELERLRLQNERMGLSTRQMQIDAMRDERAQMAELQRMFTGGQPDQGPSAPVPETGAARFAAPQMATTTPDGQGMVRIGNRTMTRDEATATAEAMLLNPKTQDVGTAILKRIKSSHPDYSSDDYKVVDGRLIRIGRNGPSDVTPFDRRDRVQEKINQEFFKTDASTVGDYRKESDDAESLIGKLDRLEAARSQTQREGPISNMLPSVFPAAQQVDSAATEIQLEFTKQTKGAITEREMALFANATPGWQMTDTAAKPVIDAMRAAAERKKERAKFYDAWLRSRQSLAGAAEAWSSFMNDNPILEQDKGGAYRVNMNNVGNWRNYLTGQRQEKEAPRQNPDAPSGWSARRID